jgi:DNA invertase Pin-like site-specific DNA recombinase
MKNKKLRVAVYSRIGGGNLPDYHRELEKAYYKAFVEKNAAWEYSGFYFDNSAGTKTNSRSGLERLLADCREGKIDLIVTKNIARLYRNFVDTLSLARELIALDPPVGIYFETIGLNTLNMGEDIFLYIAKWFDMPE